MATKRKPRWLKIKLPSGSAFKKVKATLKEFDLHTVCEESGCPNLGACWSQGTATFMILGDICTRNCRFCSVRTGNPRMETDPDEPKNVAWAVESLNLNYLVLTSVDRDDLPDGGGGHFAETIRYTKNNTPKVRIEALIPDFQGKIDPIKKVLQAGPDVIGHNLEAVRRLSSSIRDPRASYDQSLKVLSTIKELKPDTYTKSSLILGLGETEEEVLSAMNDLRKVGVDFLTLGQYLQPTKQQIEVAKYIPPQKFNYYQREGEQMGFKYVASGPLVRSSYNAAELFNQSVGLEKTHCS